MEIQHKANLLLAHPSATALADCVAVGLTLLVEQHATDDGRTTLLDILTGTVAEYVLMRTLKNNKGVLNQPFDRAGFFAIRNEVDEACTLFESLLAADVTR